MALTKFTCSRLPLMLAAWVVICMVYLSATRPTWANEWRDKAAAATDGSAGEPVTPPQIPYEEKPPPPEEPATGTNPQDHPYGDIPVEQADNVNKPAPTAATTTTSTRSRVMPVHDYRPTQYYNAPSPDEQREPENVTVWEDAHMLYDADYFFGHFRKVFMQKGMTMSEAKAGCNWDKDAKVNFQYGSDIFWAKEETHDIEIDARRKQAYEYVKNGTLPWEKYKHHFSGRGIVLAGGNELSYFRIEVICKQLARLGSTIPMEIHYWDEEMDEKKVKTLTGIYPHLFFNDLSDPATNIEKTQLSPLINWHLKSVALFNSRFAECLMLDADNIPVIDPALLFESKTYQTYGTVFWPDIARTRPNNPLWAISNTACRMDEYEAESGQLLVDKRKFWYHLQLSFWMNDHTEGWYNQFLLGDKDMFRFAWHILKTKYGKPKYWITTVGTLTNDFYCGHTFAQHHPDDERIAFLHGGTLKSMTREVMTYQRDHGGVFAAYKQAPNPTNKSEIINVGVKWDGGEYLASKPKDLRPAWCTDFWDLKPAMLDQVIPGGFEHIFKDLGGYWPLDLECDPRDEKCEGFHH